MSSRQWMIFTLLNRDDRNESVVVGCATRKNLAVHFVLENHDATIPRVVHNKCVARVKLDRLVRCKIRYRFGSASAEPPNHSLAPVCSGFPSWSRSSLANSNDSSLLLISIVRQAAVPFTPPKNSSSVFT